MQLANDDTLLLGLQCCHTYPRRGVVDKKSQKSGGLQARTEVEQLVSRGHGERGRVCGACSTCVEVGQGNLRWRGQVVDNSHCQDGALLFAPGIYKCL